MNEPYRETASLTVKVRLEKSGLPKDHRDDRHDQVVHERVDDRGERNPADECDRQLDDVPAREEVAELLEHGTCRLP